MSAGAFKGVLARIAREVGPEVATKLATRHGGTEIYIPKRAEGSSLAKLIGVDAVRKLRSAFPGEDRLHVPGGQFRNAGARRAKAMQMLDKGATARQAAEAAGVTVRAVFYAKASLEQDDPAQPKLPFDKD